MSFSFLLLDAQVRAACRNAAVTFYEKYVEILVHPRPSDLSLTVSVGYLPSGYHLADTISQDGLISLTYQDESGGRILIQYNRLYLVQQADAEHYTVEDIQVHSCDGKFFLSQDPGFSNMLLWYSENGTYTILADLEKAELLKIAENIQ